jgi:hypothetical protein
MSLAGLDVNATAVRGVAGAEGVPPRLLAVGEAEAVLPVAISLQGRAPEVGRAGAALCRQSPHLCCADFLAHLGTPRTWSAGRHRVDAGKAVALVCQRLRPVLADVVGVSLVLPVYLSRSQTTLLLSLARKARLPALGNLPAPLAAVAAAGAERPSSGLVLVLDADDHALTWAGVRLASGQAHLLGMNAFPQLSQRAWKGCLLDAVAEWCIHHSRRDPRDSAPAEQMLYDQLDDVLEYARQEQMVEVVIRTAQWGQNLILRPEQVRAFCARLVDQTVDLLRALPEGCPDGLPSALVVTASAAALPGLSRALRDGTPERVSFFELPADALARAAHQLAVRQRRGELPQGHLDAAYPLPADRPPEGPGKRVIPMASSER